jgi:hypothetical protein
MKRNGLRRTFETFETSNAVLLAVLQWEFLRNGTYRAFLYALLAMCTLLIHIASQNTETRKDRHESSQRAEISTPESFAYYSQSNDDDEDNKDEEIDFEQGQWNGREDEWITRKEALYLRQNVIKDEDDGRIKGDDKCPGDQTDRIEYIKQLPCHESCDNGKEKDAIAQSSERPII